jgi:hypothetical protein
MMIERGQINMLEVHIDGRLQGRGSREEKIEEQGQKKFTLPFVKYIRYVGVKVIKHGAVS